MTLCKSFIRPHLGYGDVVYDESNNETFCGKQELVQLNAALAITGEIKGSFGEKVCKETGLECLKSRRRFK